MATLENNPNTNPNTAKEGYKEKQPSVKPSKHDDQHQLDLLYDDKENPESDKQGNPIRESGSKLDKDGNSIGQEGYNRDDEERTTTGREGGIEHEEDEDLDLDEDGNPIEDDSLAEDDELTEDDDEVIKDEAGFAIDQNGNRLHADPNSENNYTSPRSDDSSRDSDNGPTTTGPKVDSREGANW